jgi:chemotaxis protein CheZ
MPQLAADSVDRIVDYLREDRPDRLTVGDVVALADLMARSFDGVFQSLDAAVWREFQGIAEAIAGMRREIGALSMRDLSQDRIPAAGRELEAIVEATETATNAIMESAEAIMAGGTGDENRDAVEGECLRIFEACAFQDITGQRVSKVVETLALIETRVARFAETVGHAPAADETPHDPEQDAREERKRRLILHGPQLKGEGVDQDAVDAMLSEDAGSSQDDIDALFA